ncbi:CDP-diacylglycerol--glycerol-3-phosphate 3-phosphatidyltransferase, mitochondrial isoform X2 [Canis lupus baileyi]|uniref:CDP-diacylglycerol--glycerol-3-phosphate 3-phosphatidyltransferase, mitochondrial isoform X2 n=1 Tax=Canis lupus familiaris TaxID=9615 RepID=UPI0015F16469|nr:CDP-diacylglycerol--glycerol-3-phosphate 3-phosphatidyltransferase, mitochondrial isoform X2 [Canis lupus familiaris]XP_038480358.1 CDP-diacylglycerol--glycerol-3-phosphate 3-phosphatidyltransferase, mitochondrial isoform X2 [Canis lupus familiaris]XP_038531489.1 CDP-diacylglycerol--glycerol-3-phosphate 3-phosphatidyltransferase, mitochondrial isoform X2 [Canis lupus familiaris]XP_048969825.1 CDP-diacylglycerol--glycerol-3-phosphate 3-phosphatidyltransferase, mitochondrial isoform X2 [Canis l
MAAAAAAAAGPVLWRRLLGLLPGRPGLAALLGRLSDRLGRNRDRRRRRSPWLLLAPLLSPAVPQVTSPPCCLCPEGVHRFQWIRNLVPEFGVSSSHVRVLASPAEFFELMKGQIKVAKRRVVMASLYLGTGPLEQELVDCLENTLEKSLQAKFPSDLKVSILLDFTRGSRGRKNSRTMLLPLLQRFPEQVRVSLFHTPNLRGLLRLLIPERFNETIGLQHIKVYLFDNNIILSGANLSDSYFTNRQDRYVFLQDCPEIADFFTELVDAVGDVSLQLQGDDTVQVVEGMVHPYKGDRAAYCRAANKRVMDVINSARARQQVLHAQTFHGDSLLTQEDAAAAGDRRPAPDTWIYPLIQMKPFEIQIDEIVTETLLTEAERGAKIYLTTGYFNLTQAYMDLVLGTRAEYQILLASPEVNGFFGAKGVAGAIPAAYVHIERQFYREVCSLGQQERVQLQEYWRRGWTFHAKELHADDLGGCFRKHVELLRVGGGLWLYLAGSSLPCLTLIGSPNFGYRSVHRDLEAQIAIVTESRALQQQLHQEQEQLYLRSGVVSSSTFEQPSRQVKLWVKMVTPLIKNFF